MKYVQSAGYHPGMAVCADVLCTSFSDQPRQFKAGDEVVRRSAILFVEVTAKQTASLARSIKASDKPDGRVLRFKLPEGGQAEISGL